MRNETDSKKDCSVGLTPSVPWRIRSVKPLDGYCLSIQFMDGLQGLADLSGLVSEKDPGVFVVLRDERFFLQAHVDCGAVTWPGNLDLAPDAMYEAIKKTGKYVL